jgi:DNA-binding beta-propeller fold protein YncE
MALIVGACACDRAVVFPSGATFPAAALPGAGQSRLVITNSGDDSLSFVSLDLPTPRLLSRAPVGDDPVDIEAPHDVAVSPSGDALYVVLSNPGVTAAAGPHGAHGASDVPGSFLQLDARTGAKRAELLLEPNAGEMLLDDAGATAYVAHYDLVRLERQIAAGLPDEAGFATVAIIDTASMTHALLPVCATPHDLELSHDGRTLYVTCAQTDQLAVIDLPTRKVTRVPVGEAPGAPLAPAYFPYAVLRSPADGTLWISCDRSNELRVFDPSTGSMDPTRTMPLSGVPMFGDFRADGTTLVMPHQGDDRLSIIDTTRALEVATVALSPACLNARNTRISSDDRTAYIVCEGDHQARPGTLVAVDLASRALIGTVKLGVFPTAIALAPPVP